MAVRLLSAAVAVALIFLSHFFGGWRGLYTMGGLIILGSLIEFSQFLRPDLKHSKSHIVLFVILGVLIYTASFFSVHYILPTFWCSSLVIVSYLLLRIRSTRDRKPIFQSQCFSILGLFYCGLIPSLIAQILKFPQGPGWFLTMLATVFFGDSFAYFAGLWKGRTKFFPLISPKKTWEGACGGLIGSALFGYLFSHWFLSDIEALPIVLISICCGAIGQLGDLFESLVKRVADIKDSGRIMPGHGGILDRIDGVLFAGPVFYFLVKFVYF